MRHIRVHISGDLQDGCERQLPDSVAAHVSRVLRLGVGDALQVFNGDGHQYAASIVQADKRGVRVRIGASEAVDRESPLRLQLLQGVSRGDRMDYTVQKAVELGVTDIVPVITERCGVQLDAERWEKKREHWQRIVESACEQCGRNRVPAVQPVQRLDAALATPGEGTRLILDPQATLSLPRLPVAAQFTLLAGPEGGLSEQDLRVARSAGFIGVQLGPRILRTETAALAALAVLQAMQGDFR